MSISHTGGGFSIKIETEISLLISYSFAIHRVSRHTVISNLLLTKGRGKVRFYFMFDLLSIYTAIYDSITNF